MFVRIRTSMWNLDDVDKAVDWYTKLNVPIVLTFMRYYYFKNINKNFRDFYIKKKHVTNSYYCLNEDGHKFILNRYKGRGIRTCGTLTSSFCVDCGNCELLYWKFHSKKIYNQKE